MAHTWDAFDDIVAVYLARFDKEQVDRELWAQRIGVDKGTLNWRIANAKKVQSENIGIADPQTHNTNEDAAKMTIAVVNLMQDLEAVAGQGNQEKVQAAFKRYIENVYQFVQHEDNR